MAMIGGFYAYQVIVLIKNGAFKKLSFSISTISSSLRQHPVTKFHAVCLGQVLCLTHRYLIMMCEMGHHQYR